MSQTEVQLIKNGAVVDADINGMSSSKLSGALPAISGASLTNLPTPTGKVRNLIINGAMQVAQRGTSSTSSGYQTVDRIIHTGTGWDEAMTQSQSDVASGTTPYTLGFRKAFKVQNGNQTSGAGAADELGVRYSIEAQDVANSGWNYTSSSSFITLSFWVKSSVAQNFYGYLLSLDGTIQRYAFETGALSADTWTKVTKTIPGNSNIQIDNDNGEGFRIEWRLFAGTDFTDSGVSLNTWAAFASGTRTPDSPTGWYTTNDATFEITGVQLEVGSVATDFEHRSFGQELQFCKRYYQQINQESSSTSIIAAFGNGTARLRGIVPLMVEMRANPTVAVDVSGGNPTFYAYVTGPPSYTSVAGVESTKKTITVDINTSSVTAGAPYDWRGSGAFISINAEL
jgi:hypothetical protein